MRKATVIRLVCITIVIVGALFQQLDDRLFQQQTVAQEQQSQPVEAMASEDEVDVPEEDVDETDEFPQASEDVVQTNARVTNVVDGDTLDAVFDDGLEARIRFLGVNTPESVDPRRTVECFGKEASAFSKQLLLDQRVLLEADPQADERDKYGRLLRNVYLSDGTDVNALLVEKGYAHAYLSFPLNAERKNQLKLLENSAKESGVGLWDTDVCSQ